MPRKKMETKVFDWKKTAIKFGKNLVYVLLAGLAALYADNPLYLVAAPALNALENILKNK